MGLFDSYKFKRAFSFFHVNQDDRIIGKADDLKKGFDSRANELSDAFDKFVAALGDESSGDSVITRSVLASWKKDGSIDSMPIDSYDPNTWTKGGVADQHRIQPIYQVARHPSEDTTFGDGIGMMSGADKEKLDRITLPDGTDNVPVPQLATVNNYDVTSEDTAATPALVNKLANNGVSISVIWTNPTPDDSSGMAETTEGITPTISGEGHLVTEWDVLACEFKLYTTVDVKTTAFLVVNSAGTQAVRATAHNAGGTTYSRSFYVSGAKFFFSTGSQGTTKADAKAMVPLRVYGISLQDHSSS